jgi:aldehyde:ferredoxin oxidoreductase
MNGWTGKALRINLSTGEITHEEIDHDILKAFLGGRGLGAYFIHCEVPPTIDPLGPENLLAFCTGPLTGTTVPTGGRSSLSTLSPLTHTIFDSNSGAAFGSRLKWAGYDALLIHGRSDKPVWLEVNGDGASLHPANGLWGKNIPETVEHLAAKDSAVVCIGPAGENRVLLAAIMDEKGHAYGRGGVGAVMGSKNLKAILAFGKERPVAADPTKLEFVEYEARKWISASPRTSQGLPEFGTSVLVNIMNNYGVLPTRNFQEGVFEQAEEISGESLRDHHLIKRSACLSCPIGCRRQTKTDNEKGDGPEYETIYALGSNLGISDFEALIEANYLCNRLGLDTISVGATLSCAMELAERNLLETNLRFGETTHIKEAITDMAYRRGVGNWLSEGSRLLAERCGASETAMQVKGLELPGYDPRGMQGQGLLYATSNRGACHLRGNMLGPELLGVPKMLNRHATSGKAGVLIVMQHTSTVIDSIGLCKFAGFAIGDEFFARLLSAVTGEHYEVQDMLTAGERIWNLERIYNLKAGFTSADDTLPMRFLETPHTKGASQGKVVQLAPMLKEYYRFRGWDAYGVPTPQKLKALDLVDIAQEATNA